MSVDRRLFSKFVLVSGTMAGFAPALAQTKTVKVSMDQSRFVPNNVTISVGDTVEWTNPAAITHTVTFDPGTAAKPEDATLPPDVMPFGSADMGQGRTYSYTFTVKGIYKYFCGYHETMGMVGTVIVS